MIIHTVNVGGHVNVLMDVMSKKHPVFQDMVSLNAVFINQLLKSDAKHAL